MSTPDDEKILIRAILDGDVQQYAKIVQRYQQHVANLVYKIAGNKLDIEELVQQVFVELYVSLQHFRFESKLSTFIYRITVNLVNKALTRHGRYVSLPDNEQEGEADNLNEEENMIREEQYRRLHEAIGRLKGEQRTALVLHTFEDFSYQDIAEIMSVSLSKVESLIFRAKKNLKKILEQQTN